MSFEFINNKLKIQYNLQNFLESHFEFSDANDNYNVDLNIEDPKNKSVIKVQFPCI